MICPFGYTPLLDVRDTVLAIKRIKDTFEQTMTEKMRLTRVSAPIFVRSDSGINDNLGGVEQPVGFITKDSGIECEIVHSLAKWKRLALKRYGFHYGTGLYTDMNAIRKDELTDNLHSVYVDQWDWEMKIPETDRTMETLKNTAAGFYRIIKTVEAMIVRTYDCFETFLPAEISFITTQELEDRWPGNTPREREDKIVKERGAVFLSQIGDRLKSGSIHDTRAPDYDDWSLNGDIIVYYPLLDCAVELSSMGIRVDPDTLRYQLSAAGCTERAELPFHKELLDGKLPPTMGGGIGQSRLCMILLQKAHIGEVQCSVWPEATINSCNEHHIPLL